ncbi:unnamed protein product [Triticum turgidum subsp. durum]|uniref:BHLH domain-containing protein n=1 Tax=Triticum turgidum subsp. durum TaxID=4567 RepID=A0A9R0S678_TRITD|nr:unnamed protein product [Triticum turgidum subsp. durum]
MGAHGDRRRHRREEVGVLLDEEEEELEHHARACGGATSGLVDQELGGCQEGGGGMVFEASSSVGSFAYDHSGGASSSSEPLGFGAGLYMGHHGSPVHGMMMPPPFGASPFGDFGRMTAQEIMDAKALAASKSHSEAERRRRERINSHLARLRSLLPNTTKTDKASLLAEVIQHVKELKRQTSEIREEACPLPTEADELTVDASSDEDGRLLVRASLCCDDRPDLLPDLIRALKALRLRALKAEITTLGGRVKNVLVVTEDDSIACDGDQQDEDGGMQAPMSPQHAVASIQEALRAVSHVFNLQIPLDCMFITPSDLYYLSLKY